jgi:Mrp family chromosome partitioning ATPase
VSEDAKEQTGILKSNEHSSVRRIVGVISGKGGVGKSLVTAMLAVLAQRDGYSVGIMDADITGPSIPQIFGLRSKAQYSELGVFPAKTEERISVISSQLLMEQADMPVAWRGPLIADVVKQFWTDVSWGDIAYMFIDMPPGTGDVPLTVFQALPLDGVIVVTTPQELVQLTVRKAYRMAREMGIPVLGIVENMSYVKYPGSNDTEFKIFGEGQSERLAAEWETEVLGRIPLDAALASLCDRGRIEFMENTCLREGYQKLIQRLN